MTGEKKSSDLSTRLGVKRTKPTLAKLSKSPSSSISAPPKAAIATTKPKKDEIQRRRNPFNDMLHHKAGKDKDKDASNIPSSKRDDAEEDVDRSGAEDSWNGEGMSDVRAADRIAELERALAVTREELAKIRDHGVVYRETIDEYRRQLAGTYNHTQTPPGAFHTSSRPTSPRSLRSTSLSMDYEQEAEPRRSFNHHRDELIEQNYDLRSKLAHLQDQLSSHEVHSQSRTHSEAEWNELTSRLHITEKESQERMQQLLSLKSSISSLTRMESQVTDSELSETLSQLANRVREWVISNFRRTKLDLSAIPPETEMSLEAISPRYSKIDPSNRLALYQALISSAMMHIFHEPIVVGLPETGPLASIRQLAAFIPDTGPDHREWRRTTIRCLEKTDAKYILQRGRETMIHRLRSEISHQLFTLTSMNVSPNAQSALDGILHAAADLQNTLLLQKAQYKVHFFRENDHRVAFDDSRMESINDIDSGMDEEGDTIVDRTFAFCVFPCLDKFGDEYGENTEVRNVLLKASVCCGVG